MRIESPLAITVLIVVYVSPFVISGFKGRYAMMFWGLPFHFLWWIGALRLARPDSLWAQWFYDDRKLRRSQERFSAPVPPIAGSPSRRKTSSPRLARYRSE